MGEGDLLFVAKEPNFTDPRNLHLQRSMLNAQSLLEPLLSTDADMSHSNCEDSKIPNGKGKQVLVTSNFYVNTFVERSDHSFRKAHLFFSNQSEAFEHKK